MSLVTRFINLIKPEGAEKWSLALFNGNMDKIDSAMRMNPEITTSSTPPDGVRLREFSGVIFTNTGGGGQLDNKDVAFATDGNGWGGLWFGEKGLPTFNTVTYIRIDHVGASDAAFMAEIVIQEVNSIRVRFRAKRQDSGGWANNFSGLTLYVRVIGW